jgi:hypothetical protein
MPTLTSPSVGCIVLSCAVLCCPVPACAVQRPIVQCCLVPDCPPLRWLTGWLAGWLVGCLCSGILHHPTHDNAGVTLPASWFSARDDAEGSCSSCRTLALRRQSIKLGASTRQRRRRGAGLLPSGRRSAAQGAPHMGLRHREAAVETRPP